MAISAGSIPCPPYIQDQEQHRKAITNWMMRVSPLVTSTTPNTFVTQDSLSAVLATLGGGFVPASSFNVQGDTRRISSPLYIADGTASLSATSASFTAGDVGKALTIAWNAAAGTFTSTILSVNSTTNVVLASNIAGTTLNSAAGIVTLGTDDRSAMQVAIAHCISVGGATLFIDAGWYTLGGMLSIGSTMSIVGSGWKGLRSIATSASLDWAQSPAFGTVLFPNFMDGSGSACIRVAAHSCQLKNFEVEVVQPLPGTNWAHLSAPWCIKAYRAPFQYEGGDGLLIENVMMRNPTKGVRFQGTSRGWVNGLFGQPFLYGLYVSGNYDVFRAENVHFWPFYDLTAAVMADQQALGDGIVLGKVDNPMFNNIFCFHMRSMFHIFNSNEADINPNGYTQRMHANNLGADDCMFGFFIQDNVHASITNMYAYCASTSAGAATPSSGFLAVSAIGQGAPTHLDLTNIDLTGATGNAMRFENNTSLNIQGLRFQSFNGANAGYAGISMARSSTCNVVNIIDLGAHFTSSLFEATSTNVKFNWAQGPDISMTYRTTGANVPNAGTGVEISYDTSLSAGFVVGYNRTSSVYVDMNLHGKTITFKTGTSLGTVVVASINSTGDLNIAGGINGANGLSISGGAIITGNVNIGSNLTVVGNLVAGGLSFTNLQVGGTLSVSGDTVMTGGLTVHQGFSVSGGSIIQGNAFFGANMTVSGTLVVGAFGITNLSVPGTTTLSGTTVILQGLTCKNGISVSGGIALTGNVAALNGDFTGALSAQNGVNTNIVTSTLGQFSSLSVANGLTVTTNLSVGGTAIMTGAVSMNSSLVVTGGITSRAGLSVSGGVAMTGACIIGSVGNFTSDANAAAGGVAIGQLYRNGSALQIRVT